MDAKIENQMYLMSYLSIEGFTRELTSDLILLLDVFLKLNFQSHKSIQL